MSNQSAGQVAIDLKSPLDMNLNKNTVREFQGFTKRNSPYINGGLSPMFNQKGIQADVIKKDGKTYKLEYDSVRGGYVFNNIINSPVYKYRIDQKVITPPSRDMNLKYAGTFNGKELWVGYISTNINYKLIYFYDNIYFETNLSNITCIYTELEVSIFNPNCVGLASVLSGSNLYLIKEILYDPSTNTITLGKTVSYSRNDPFLEKTNFYKIIYSPYTEKYF